MKSNKQLQKGLILWIAGVIAMFIAIALLLTHLTMWEGIEVVVSLMFVAIICVVFTLVMVRNSQLRSH